MSKKLIFFLCMVLLFSFHKSVFASPLINEIMYDLDGPDIDWVEIYNPDSNDVDLTTLKLLISNSTSNHGIVKSSGSQILHQGDYGVIVVTSQLSAFISKWNGISNIFTSSFSLNNDSGKIEINNGDKTVPISSVTYSSAQGATEDGNSLQLIGGSWVASVPTPGAQNQLVVVDENNSSDNTDPANNDATGGGTTDDTNANTTSSVAGGGGASSSGSSASSMKITQAPKIKVKIISKSVAFTGIPFTLQAQASGYNNEQLYGKYYWNFGDGESHETNDNSIFPHTYLYPGDYPVSLEFYANYYSDIPDATAKLTIKVVPMVVTVSRVGEADDFFIELSNNTNYDIDISKWILQAGAPPQEKKFTFPKDTIILSKKHITISPKITNFSADDKSTLKLLSTDGKIIFDYGASIAAIPSPAVAPEEKPESEAVAVLASPSSKQKTENPSLDIPSEVKPQAEDISEISQTNLAAAVLQSGVLPIDSVESSNKGHGYISLFIFLALVGIGGSAAYFVRKRKTIILPGDDFSILDE